jgi:enoyl-CoA hydratase
VTAVYPVDQFDAEVDKVWPRWPVRPWRRADQGRDQRRDLTELEAALEREKQGQLVLIETDDFREGTRAFQQRRVAKFTDS